MEIPHCRREHHDIAGALLVRQNEFAGCHRSQESGEWVHSVPQAEAAGNDSALNQRRSSLRGAGHRLNGLIGRGPSRRWGPRSGTRQLSRCTAQALEAKCGGREWGASGRVESIVTGNKIIPATVNNLPEGRRPRAPRMVNGGRGGHATEYAEARNRQCWPSFDWLQSPQEAYLAFRD